MTVAVVPTSSFVINSVKRKDRNFHRAMRQQMASLNVCSKGKTAGGVGGAENCILGGVVLLVG